MSPEIDSRDRTFEEQDRFSLSKFESAPFAVFANDKTEHEHRLLEEMSCFNRSEICIHVPLCIASYRTMKPLQTRANSAPGDVVRSNECRLRPWFYIRVTILKTKRSAI